MPPGNQLKQVKQSGLNEFMVKIKRLPILQILLLFIIFYGISTGSWAQTGIYPFTEKGKIGYKSSGDSIIIPAKYDFAEEFHPDFAWTVVGIGDWELMNNSITERQVKFSGKFGMIDSAGNEIIKPVYDLVLALYPEYAVVGYGQASVIYQNFPEGKGYDFQGLMGVINQHNEPVVPVKYNSIDMVRHKKSRCWFVRTVNPPSAGLFIKRKSVILPDSTKDIHDYSDGLALIHAGNKWGYIDTSGHIFLSLKYDRAKDFKEGTALVKESNRYYYIDRSGTELADKKISFDEVGRFQDELAWVKVFDQYGYINEDSIFFKIPRFTEASSFFNDIASVTTLDSFGYIFKDCREDLAAKYDQRNDFSIDQITALPPDLNTFDSISINSPDTTFFFKPVRSLDLKNMLYIGLNAIRWAPYIYFQYPHMLAKVCAGEGTLAGKFIFNADFLDPANPAWKSFREEVLFRIIRDEKLRENVWDWMKPFCRIIFKSMPELHRQVYREMLAYLDNYYKNYDIERTRDFLNNHWVDFAYYHPDGTTSPFRKTSALIDRLILVNQLIDPSDVSMWLEKIRKEMENW